MFKKLIALTTSLVLSFGAFSILPQTGILDDISITASADDVLTWGDYHYRILDDGTVEIISCWVIHDNENVIIPERIDGRVVTSLAEGAFDHQNCESINMPDTITKIGERCFRQCLLLKHIHLSANLEKISAGAFFDCIFLEEITIPESITEIEYGAFHYCKFLKTIIFSEGLNKIDEMAFDSCYDLENITLPSTVSYIGANAFKDCRSLRSINLPKSIDIFMYDENRYEYDEQEHHNADYFFSKVSNGPFTGCDNLTNITIDEGVTRIPRKMFMGTNGIEEIVVPDSVQVIDHNAFAWCENLKKVNIGSGVNTLYADCFTGCKNLEELNVSSNNVKYSSYDGVVYKKMYNIAHELVCYPNGKNTTNIPESVAYIDDCAFYNSTGLINLTLSDIMIGIGYRAFEKCDHLISLTIPRNVSRIDFNAFLDCPNLTIKCYRDSCAHQYAIDNNIRYELLDEQTPGDITGDGNVNMRDLATLQRYINGWDVQVDETIADVNKDGNVNMRDYALIQRFINGWDVELK